ncbi:MAG TPA: metal-dependent transcriptional regulator [Candidatus Bathyarchaeota archaeon]|nr:metal-dependent transcriptional regulator [Candidatus Bathyarchaeota archaeon]
MTRKVTASVERYLKGIYILQKKKGVARTSELVKLFGVVSGTITNTMKRLERDGLVAHQPYRGVKLTEEGRKIALYAMRKHRLLSRLLTEILHIEQTLAYEVAFNIGYYIPDSVIEKIEEALETKQDATTCF